MSHRNTSSGVIISIFRLYITYQLIKSWFKNKSISSLEVPDLAKPN